MAKTPSAGSGRGGAAPKKILGIPEARLYPQPLRPLNRYTSYGYDVIDFAEAIGQPLIPWQQWCVKHLMEINRDGTYRFRTGLVMVARQSGKSHLVRMMTLWRMLFDEDCRLVLGTAQDLAQASNQWKLTLAIVKQTPYLARRLAYERHVNGQEAFGLKNGAEYMVRSANANAGRGFSVDGLILDELRTHRDRRAWSALNYTTMARPNPLTICVSNAGDDESVVLNGLREAALSGKDSTVGLFEWSAPEGCELDDINAWRQANPGLGHTVSITGLKTALATDPPNVFRCLDVNTPVLTACGIMSIDKLQAGDVVKGTSGEWIDVVGTSETHVGRDCYRVTLNDGRSIVCDADHLWTVRDRRRPRPRFETLRTTDLISRGVTYHNPSMNYDVRNFSLPPVAPLDGPDVDLPVHPYLLGLWLGDGSRRSATIFTEDRDADHIAARMEAAGATITTRTKDSAHCERFGFQVGRPGAFTTALRSLGIYPQMAFRKAGPDDFRKFIPDVYLTGSLTQRLDLLRGLMDSDGTVRAHGGRCCFVNTNAELIAGVRSLVRSLGWKTSELEAGQYGKSHHLPRLSVDFTPRPGEPCPVTLPRKTERIRAARGPRDVRPATIASIEPVPSVPVRCIQVDAADSLFLAGDMVPTHNTEALCQKVDQLDGAIDLTCWEDCADPIGTLDEHRNRIAACFDVSLDGKHATLAVAAMLPDDRVRIEIAGAWDSTEAARFELAHLLDRIKPQVFGWFPTGPAASLASTLRARRGSTELTGSKVTEACQEFSDLVKARRIAHKDDPLLNAHIKGADKHISGDGYRYTRKGDGHVDAAYAAAGAAKLALTLPPPRRARVRMIS